MKIIKNNFCQVYLSESSINSFKSEYENYCIGVYSFAELDLEKNHDIPTLIIGWDFVKNNFKKHKISQKKIKKNFFWTFSEAEDIETNQKDVQKFISKSLSEYLPDNYKNFDCVLDGKLIENLDSIFSEDINFCFFSANILFVYNKNNFIGISLDSISYVFDNECELIEIINSRYKIIYFNYNNLPQYLRDNKNLIFTLENICWICNNFILSESSLYKFSPFPLNEKYYVFLMKKFYDLLNCKLLENHKIIERYNKKDYITDWLSSRRIHFSNGKKLVLKYSNKRTITGRINCVDKKFNPQILSKTNEIRKEIVSEFNKGKIVVFDFVSFETKLSVLLSKDEVFIENVKEKDLHLETSKIIFKKDNISHEERKVGKTINHSIIYGAGDERLRKILIENNLSLNLIKEIKKFLKPIIDNSKKTNDEFNKIGYIINPYNSIIYPNKQWAVYNNFIQSIAADLVIDKLFKIKNIIENKKSEFMYQIYDSFVFDIHPEELYLIEEIKKTLQKLGNNYFEVKVVLGDNLMECTDQNEEEEIDIIN